VGGEKGDEISSSLEKLENVIELFVDFSVKVSEGGNFRDVTISIGESSDVGDIRSGDEI
jgi:hypothetical protein